MKKTKYQVPEGKYRGVFSAGYRPRDKKKGRNNANCIRVEFKLPGMQNAVVKRNYDLSKPSGKSFEDVAEVLLGRKITAEELNNPYMVLKGAVGKKVDLSITHRQLPKYSQPLVCIDEVKPAGTWIKDGKASSSMPVLPSEPPREEPVHCRQG